MKLLAILFTIVLSNQSYAQIAGASLFKEMKSENPAVLVNRPAATFSLKSKKTQCLKNKLFITLL